MSFGNRGVTVLDTRPPVPTSSEAYTRAPFERFYGPFKPDAVWHAVDQIIDEKIEEVTGRDVPKSLVERVGRATGRLLKSGRITEREVYSADRWLEAYEIAEYDPNDLDPSAEKVSKSRTSYDGRVIGRIGKSDELRHIVAVLGRETHLRLVAFVHLSLSQHKTARWLSEQDAPPPPENPQPAWDRAGLKRYTPEWAKTFADYDRDRHAWETAVRRDAASRLSRMADELVADLHALSDYYNTRDRRPAKAA